MKIILHTIIILLSVISIGCFPGIRADRLDGIVVDRSTNLPLKEVVVDALEVMRDDKPYPQTPVITDEEGRFSLPPHYGFIKLLEPVTDWRNMTFSKEGYTPERITVMTVPQTNMRYINFDRHKNEHRQSIEDQFVIKLQKH